MAARSAGSTGAEVAAMPSGAANVRTRAARALRIEKVSPLVSISTEQSLPGVAHPVAHDALAIFGNRHRKMNVVGVIGHERLRVRKDLPAAAAVQALFDQHFNRLFLMVTQ